MECKNCGKALGNEQATCPFCGAFIRADQISAYNEMKKEKSHDLRPNLISERYGMDPIKYEQQRSKTNNHLIVLLLVCGMIVITFVVVVIFMF